jgi:hypothetical protein
VLKEHTSKSFRYRFFKSLKEYFVEKLVIFTVRNILMLCTVLIAISIYVNFDALFVSIVIVRKIENKTNNILNKQD